MRVRGRSAYVPELRILFKNVVFFPSEGLLVRTHDLVHSNLLAVEDVGVLVYEPDDGLGEDPCVHEEEEVLDIVGLRLVEVVDDFAVVAATG